MFEMYAESGTSFGDISRYFEENDIKLARFHSRGTVEWV